MKLKTNLNNDDLYKEWLANPDTPRLIVYWTLDTLSGEGWLEHMDEVDGDNIRYVLPGSDNVRHTVSYHASKWSSRYFTIERVEVKKICLY
jgi:hypothetical protein